MTKRNGKDPSPEKDASRKGQRKPAAGKVAPLRPRQEPDSDNSNRLDVYIIDSGWYGPPHYVLHKSMDMIRQYLTDHNLFIMTEEQSVDFLKRHPHLVGRDPVLVVVDPRARERNDREGYGASVVLGRIDWVLGRPENTIPDERMVQAMIKMFLRLVNCHDGSKNIAGEFRKFNHKQGTRGTLEIVMDSLGREAMVLGEA